MQSTVFFSLINLFIYLSIYLFLAVLGLRCCVQALSSCGERGLLFVVVRGLLIVVASFVAEHGIQAHGLQQLWHEGFSSCGSWALERRLGICDARALLLRCMWDLPRPGLEPVSPALAGRFLTTVPPGKPQSTLKCDRVGRRRDDSFPQLIFTSMQKAPCQGDTLSLILEEQCLNLTGEFGKKKKKTTVCLFSLGSHPDLRGH